MNYAVKCIVCYVDNLLCKCVGICAMRRALYARVI